MFYPAWLTFLDVLHNMRICTDCETPKLGMLSKHSGVFPIVSSLTLIHTRNQGYIGKEDRGLLYMAFTEQVSTAVDPSSRCL